MRAFVAVAVVFVVASVVALAGASCVVASVPFRGQHEQMMSSQGAYDPAVATRAVFLSKVASCEEPNINNWACTVCKNITGPTDATVFHHESAIDTTFGYVAYDPQENSIIVAFRGTDSVADWITNVDFVKKPFLNYPNAKVHEGFLRAYKAVEDDMKRAFKLHHDAHPDAKVEVAGHSLGGALTSIAAIDLVDSYNLKDVSAFTFGSPRVGDEGFAKLHREKVKTSWRVVHWDDVVPTVPLLMMGFHHVGTEVLYNLENTRYEVCDGSGEDPKCERWGTSSAQHGNYLGIPMSCPRSSTPGFYFGTNMVKVDAEFAKFKARAEAEFRKE